MEKQEWQQEFKNRLMVYKGGGYDGCFWEWNLCLWDNNGNWHNILASGYMGCKTEESAFKLMEDNFDVPDKDEKPGNVCFGGKRAGQFEIFNIQDNRHMIFFRDEYNPQLVKGVLEYLIKNDIEHVLTMKCYKCEMVSGNPDDFLLCNESGDGGLAISSKDMICTDCDSLSRCGYCGESYDDDDVKKFDSEGYCERCHEKQIEQYQFRLEEALKRNDWDTNWTGIQYLNSYLRKYMGIDEQVEIKDCEGQMWFIFGQKEVR
jgi:hypothetical protein